jgi:hypothetical protein
MLTVFLQQIVHLPTHLFYEDEVFKTGHMVDHPVEDIMERVGCQFFTKVCSSDRDRLFDLLIHYRNNSTSEGAR